MGATLSATVACLLLAGPFQAPEPSAPSAPSAPRAPAVDDFKLVIRLFGAGQNLRGQSELVFHGERTYQFVVNAPDEVIVHDRGAGMVELIDLKRRLITEIPEARLVAASDRLRKAIEATIAKREGAGDRAGRVAAQMSRDLIDPQFTPTYDPARHAARMRNATIEIDALGTPEPDPARLALIDRTLEMLANLGTLREPAAIPPYARLAAHDVLIDTHALRPIEVSILYRLAGPPIRYRWAFEFVAELTDRERQALVLVDELRVRARSVRFETYERAEK